MESRSKDTTTWVSIIRIVHGKLNGTKTDEILLSSCKVNKPARILLNEELYMIDLRRLEALIDLFQR